MNLVDSNSIIRIIEEIQHNSGHESIVITEDTIPIGDLPGFDSLRGVEATVLLEERLKIDVGGDVNPFVAKDGIRALTIKEVTQNINKHSIKGRDNSND